MRALPALLLAVVLVGVATPASSAQAEATVTVVAPAEVGFGLLFDLEIRRAHPEDLRVEALDLADLRPLDLAASSLEREVASGRVTEIHRLRVRAFVLDGLTLDGIRLTGRRGDEEIEIRSDPVAIAVASALADDDAGRAEAPEGPLAVPPRPRDRGVLLLVAFGLGIVVCYALWWSRRRLEAGRDRRGEAGPEDRFRAALERADLLEGRDRATAISAALRDLLRDLDLVEGPALAVEDCLAIPGDRLGEDLPERLAAILPALEDLAYRSAAPPADEIDELRRGAAGLAHDLIERRDRAAEGATT